MGDTKIDGIIDKLLAARCVVLRRERHVHILP